MFQQMLNPYWPLVAVYGQPDDKEPEALEVHALALDVNGQVVAVVWDPEKRAFVDAASRPNLLSIERDDDDDETTPAAPPNGGAFKPTAFATQGAKP